MLVFYHFADKDDLVIESYKGEAEGTVEKTKNGLRFTSVRVHAHVKVTGKDIAGKLQKMAELAEKYCLVSNSVTCPVNYTVTEAKYDI
jgi:organic hydroperoxide reductase OsmC/OhrA